MWYIAFKNTFQLHDSNYIAALINLYPGMEIESFSVNSVNFPCKGKTFKDLNDLINDAKLKFKPDSGGKFEFTIISERVGAHYTTRRIFPKFKPQAQYLINPMQNNKKFELAINAIFEFVLDAPNLLMRSSEGLPGVENKDDAWRVLSLLHERLPFNSAIDLPSINGILLLTPTYVFVVSYGKKVNTISDAIYPAFDIDDGFIASPYGSIITKEMTDEFQKWKTGGMKGTLFAEQFDMQNLYSMIDILSAEDLSKVSERINLKLNPSLPKYPLLDFPNKIPPLKDDQNRMNHQQGFFVAAAPASPACENTDVKEERYERDKTRQINK